MAMTPVMMRVMSVAGPMLSIRTPLMFGPEHVVRPVALGMTMTVMSPVVAVVSVMMSPMVAVMVTVVVAVMSVMSVRCPEDVGVTFLPLLILIFVFAFFFFLNLRMDDVMSVIGDEEQNLLTKTFQNFIGHGLDNIMIIRRRFQSMQKKTSSSIKDKKIK